MVLYVYWVFGDCDLVLVRGLGLLQFVLKSYFSIKFALLNIVG
jgi:hypothetical protein